MRRSCGQERAESWVCLSTKRKYISWLTKSAGDSTPRMAALNLADGTYTSNLPPLPAGMDVFDMQVLNRNDILIGTHIDSMGPRIYNIETGKVSVVHSGSNQDGPYLYVYSPTADRTFTRCPMVNTAAISTGSRGSKTLSYSGGDIGHVCRFKCTASRKSVPLRSFINEV